MEHEFVTGQQSQLIKPPVGYKTNQHQRSHFGSQQNPMETSNLPLESNSYFNKMFTTLNFYFI
jgi:hypothetical protein